MNTIYNNDHTHFYGKSFEWVSSRFKYNPDTGEITGPHGKVLKSRDKYGYGKAQLWYDGETKKQHFVYTHRLAWFLHHGSIDPQLSVDHINGITTDNRIANLRLIPHVINCRNKALSVKNNTGYSGVWQVGNGKYRASVSGEYLGTYADILDAIRVTEEIQRLYGYGPAHGRSYGRGEHA